MGMETCLKEMDCFLMTLCNAIMTWGDFVYIAVGSLIRYWYVRLSLSANLQSNLKSLKFTNLSIFLPKILILIHLFNSINIVVKYGFEHYPFVLYKACVNPWGRDSIRKLNQVMPIDQMMVLAYGLTTISCNLYLYKFLR